MSNTKLIPNLRSQTKVIIITCFIIFIILIVLTKNKEPFVVNDNIKIYDNFITKNEAKTIIDQAENSKCFTQSRITSDDGNKVDTNTRSSYTCFFKKGENSILKNIDNKVSKILNVPISRIEPIQIVRYNKDQEFRPHHDYFYHEKEIGKSGQRIHTFLIYLNDLKEEDGGGTVFPLQNIKIKPKCGTALYFRDADDDGSVHPNSLHAGEKVLSDATKYALNVWVRQYDFV